jgi:hypothetical protein
VKLHEIGRTPWSYEPMAPKAPVERSRLPYPQPGHVSATRAVMLRPLSVLVIETVRPQCAPPSTWL